MSNFDDEEAWRDLCSIWRWSTKGRAGDENKSGRQKWDSLENKESLWPDIRRAIIVLNKGLPEGGTYPHRLWGFLSGGWETHVGSVTAKEASAPAVVAAPLPVPVRKPEPDDTDFDNLLSEWPPNPGYPEKPSAARDAWTAAVSQHGKQRVLKACRAYMAWVVEADTAFPKHLRTFLGDAEEVEIWSAREVPDAADAALFESAWAHFPHRGGPDDRKPEGKVLFFRNVLPDDRVYFVAVCKGYRRQVAVAAMAGDGSEQFTVGFARFTREWRTVRGRNTGGDCVKAIEKYLWVVFDREKLDHTGIISNNPNGLSSLLLGNGAGRVPISQVLNALLRSIAVASIGGSTSWIVRQKEEVDVNKWADRCSAEVTAAALKAACELPAKRP